MIDFDRFVAHGMYDRYLDGIPTTPASVVFDLGSYTGKSLELLAEKCQGTLYGFEPIRTFYDEAIQRTRGNPRINIFNCAVSNRDGTMIIHESGDETSLVKSGGTSTQCQLCSFETIWNHLGLTTLDVLYMNIEGGEYDVLDHILAKGFLPKIRTLVIQFHYPSDETKRMRKRFQDELQMTHDCVYDYAFVWERWTLRDQ